MELYKKTKLRTLIFTLLSSILSFALFFLKMSFSFESELAYYAPYFAEYFLDSFTTALVAFALLAGRGSESHGGRMLSALKLSLPRLVYLVPYYYLYYMRQGYDSIESLSLLSIRSLLAIALFIIEALVYYAVACFITRKSAHGWDFCEASGMFDLSVPVTRAIFSVCFLKFVFNLVSEAVDVIVYLIDYERFYSTNEIYYVLAKLLLAFFILFFSHFIFMQLRKRWAGLKTQK